MRNTSISFANLVSFDETPPVSAKTNEQASSSTLRGVSNGRILRPAFHEPCVLTMRETQIVNETYATNVSEIAGGAEETAKMKRNEEKDWTCELKGDDAALVGHTFVEIKGLSESFYVENNVTSGSTTLSVEGATIEGTEMTIPEGACPTLDNIEYNETASPRRRRLANPTGQKSVLVVRVVANDRSTTGSESKLAETVFTDGTSLQSQFSACSYGKLNFIEATGNSVTNGVTTVQINTAVSGRTYDSIEGLVESATEARFGASLSSLFDHVMFCLPPGTTTSRGSTDW
jgi:hypothetical protein